MVGIKSALDYSLRDLANDQVLTWKAIPAYATALSVFRLLQVSTQMEISQIFETILVAYEGTLKGLLWPLESALSPISLLLGEMFDVDINLGDEWRHAFFIMSLYFIVDLRVGYLRRPSPRPSVVSTIIFGTLCCMIFSFLSAFYVALDLRLAAYTVPTLGFAFYEMLKAPITSYYMPVHRKSWLAGTWYFFWNYGMINAILGAAAAGIFLFTLSPAPGAEPIILILFLLLIVIRNLATAFYRARYINSDRANWIHHFLISGSVQVASNITYSLFLTFCFAMLEFASGNIPRS